MLRISLIFLSALFGLTPIGAFAKSSLTGSQLVGHYRALTNDFLGDGSDRWRSASYQLSWVAGDTDFAQRGFPNWRAMEYRLRAEIITPSQLDANNRPDRPYVGALTFGVIRHFNLGNLEATSGIDLVFTGPQLGLDKFQDFVHNLNSSGSVAQIVGNQVGDAIYPTYVGSVARSFRLKAGNLESLVRPFAEVKMGVEDYIMAGFDVITGYGVSADLLIRDDTTGLPVTGVKRDNEWGASLLAGFDLALVGESQYLPRELGYKHKTLRARARLGVLLEGRKTDWFYGATYLTPEFQGQKEGQLLGTIYLHANF